MNIYELCPDHLTKFMYCWKKIGHDGPHANGEREWGKGAKEYVVVVPKEKKKAPTKKKDPWFLEL